ncbi:hypothetical protein FRC10_007883 [Ceratobasidium sp. 414]|nr:hypothetical protein FRC10_007883 [Ceratobasidium sp. 414]
MLLATTSMLANTVGTQHTHFNWVTDQLINTTLNPLQINIPELMNQARLQLSHNPELFPLLDNQLLTSRPHSGSVEPGPSNHRNRLHDIGPASDDGAILGMGRFEDFSSEVGFPHAEDTTEGETIQEGEDVSKEDDEEDDLYA